MYAHHLLCHDRTSNIPHTVTDGLAVSGSAPKIFSRTTRSGLPYVAVGVCSCFAFLAYMTLGTSSGIVFTWLSNFSATAGLVTWFGIGVTYIRFYKGLQAQGIDRKTLPFAPGVQPYAGWWCCCGSAFVLFVRPPSPPPLGDSPLTHTHPSHCSSALGKSFSSGTGPPRRSSPTTSPSYSSPCCTSAPGSSCACQPSNQTRWTLSPTWPNSMP